MNQQIISDAIMPTGTAYLDWCTTIRPYVHIAISNLADPRVRFTIKRENKVNVNGVLRLPLKRISNWHRFTQVMINGFTWEGDTGFLSNSYGLANGFVRSYGGSPVNDSLGNNISVGGTCSDFLLGCPSSVQPDGNKLVMIKTPTGANVTWVNNNTANVYPNTNSIVSSSTSIIRNGVCNTSTLMRRWSAVGTTSSGRMIFMSSTSSGATNTVELCEVFKTMGVVNAIRLDGSRSTAMSIDGILRNPLIGLDFRVVGPLRYIPYALKVSYPGW